MTLDENDAKAWCDPTDLVSAKLPNPTPIVAYFIPDSNPSAKATVTTIPPSKAVVWFCHCTVVSFPGIGVVCVTLDTDSFG